MSPLVTSTRRFDQEWNAVIHQLGIGQTYDKLLALKEAMRDYIAITLPGSPFAFGMEGKIYELSFTHTKPQEQLRVQLTSIKLAGSSMQPVFHI